MPPLIPLATTSIGPYAALATTTSIGPYAAVIAVGFVIGAYGHIIKSRLLILTGILIVGGVSVYVAFVLGKLS